MLDGENIIIENLQKYVQYPWLVCFSIIILRARVSLTLIVA